MPDEKRCFKCLEIGYIWKTTLRYYTCEGQNRRICKNREKEKHDDVAVNNPSGNDNTSGNKKLPLLISAKPDLSLQTAVCIISNPERTQQSV